MNVVELFVGLKIPDTTAITTFHTIENMGLNIKKVVREMYYKFEVDGNPKKFSEKVGNVDILVNANKNKFSTELEKEEGAIYILVKDIDDKCEGIMHTLKDKLGLREIKSMERGVLWALYVDSEDTAKDIAKRLLYNENYQNYEVR